MVPSESNPWGMATRINTSRRKFLKAATAVGITGTIAGCLGDDDDTEDTDDTDDTEDTDDTDDTEDTEDTDDTDDTEDTEDGGEEHQMQIASAHSSDHFLVQMANQFAEDIEEESDGQITVEVIDGGAIGGDEEISEAIQTDSVQGFVGGLVPLSMHAPEYYFIDTPFVTTTWDHFMNVWESDLFEGAHEEMQAQNHRFIGPVYRGLRNYTSNEPVSSVEDVQGDNLRLPELDTWVAVWEEIGVEPTAVSLDELYSALDQGVADSSEGPPAQVMDNSLYEVQSHYSLTQHMVQAGSFIISDSFYQGLSDDLQDLVDDVGQEAIDWANEYSEESEEELIDELEDEGMEIVDDVDTESFVEAGEPAAQELFETEFAPSWEDVQDLQ